MVMARGTEALRGGAAGSFMGATGGILGRTTARLKKKLGIRTGDIFVYDMLQQLAIIEEPVLERFGVDTIEMGRGFCHEPACWKPWTLPDGTPSRICRSAWTSWRWSPGRAAGLPGSRCAHDDAGGFELGHVAEKLVGLERRPA